MINKLWWGLVRFGFRLLYNELAFTYDVISQIVSLGAWRCWQRSALQYLEIEPGGLILELAHGTGDLQLDLHRAGYHVMGYDLSPYMGRITQVKLQRHNLVAKLVRGKAQKLPFATGSFVAVVSTFPTDFIVAPETLYEISRILRHDGLLVIVPNAVLTGGGVVGKFLEWLYRITGQREATTANITSIFQPYGFAVNLVHAHCPRSEVLVIVAHKQG
jgi:ubiquinone/menaquinone biosynthesis C-methylase UbiE